MNEQPIADRIEALITDGAMYRELQRVIVDMLGYYGLNIERDGNYYSVVDTEHGNTMIESPSYIACVDVAFQAVRAKGWIK